MKKINIKQFNILRILAVYIIMIYHINEFFPFVNIFFAASLGLYICLVLTGFLFGCNNWKAETSYSIKDSLNLYIKKLIKFYPLHLITFLIDAVIVWKYMSIASIFTKHEIFKIITNLLLLQIYIPNPEYYFSYNGVSWYLAVTLAFYFFAPLVVYWLNKVDLDKNIYMVLVTVMVIYFALMVAFGYTKYSTWVLNNSIFHVFDFIIGVILGRTYYLKNIDKDTNVNSKLIYLILLIGAIFNFAFITITGNDLFLIYSATMGAGLILYFFANNEFKALKSFDFPIINFFASFSFEVFMLHQIVGKYMVIFHNKYQIHNLICFGVSIVASIVLSYLLHIILSKIISASHR